MKINEIKDKYNLVTPIDRTGIDVYLKNGSRQMYGHIMGDDMPKTKDSDVKITLLNEYIEYLKDLANPKVEHFIGK